MDDDSINWFQQLPDELLLAIFERCIGYTDDCLDHPERFDFQTIMVQQLSHVCRRWRAVTMESAHLWTKIGSKWTEECLSPLVERWKEWLNRSGSRPLALSIDIPSTRPPGLTLESVLEAALDVILPHSNRIEQLGIWAPPSILAPLYRYEETLPMLKALHVIVNQGFMSSHFPSNLIRYSFHLEVLTVSNFTALDVAEIPTERLRIFRSMCYGWAPHNAFYLLKRSIHIESFTVYIAPHFAQTQVDNIADLRLDTLSQFYIHTTWGSGILPLLRFISAPNLEFFAYNEFSWASQTDWMTQNMTSVKEMTPFLHTSREKLLNLDIRCNILGDEEVIDLVQGLPSLEALHLRITVRPSSIVASQPFPPSFGEVLGVYLIDEKTLPKLKRLSFEFPSKMAMSGETLMKLVERRMIQRPVLNSLWLLGSDHEAIRLEDLLSIYRNRLPEQLQCFSSPSVGPGFRGSRENTVVLANL